MHLTKFQKILLGVVAIFAGIFAGSYFSYDVGYEKGVRDQVTANIKNIGLGQPEEVDFSVFWKAWNIIEDKHVSATTTNNADIQERVWGAIQGLTNSLGDPYTVFLPPEDNKIFSSDISGNFEGVGMEIGIRDNFLVVVAPLKGTPAEKAGLKSGDKIISIDDISTNRMSVDKAVRLIRGPRGTIVKLIVLHDGENKPIEIKVRRDVINIPTVDTPTSSGRTGDGNNTDKYSKLLNEKGVFVLRLYNFYSTSPNLFRQSLREFIESGADKLIIDLRGNPGGFLEASVDITSWFLPQGKIIVRENFGSEKEDRLYRSKGYNIFRPDFKFVILVDGGSASASEIMAGALQEYGRAILVGTQTFGKGSVQELIPITDESSIKVTIARWLTPNSRSISDNGLTPDEEVKITAEDIVAGLDPQLDKAVEIVISINQ